MLVSLAAATLALASVGGSLQPVERGRFQPSLALPGLPAVLVDARQTGVGFGQQMARNRGLQGRVMWIDATANLERMSSDVSIRDWIDRIADLGFNTIVYDIKPIVGRTVYPSALTLQLLRWRDQRMPEGYDPVAAVLREGRRRGLSVMIALNAFSEGHRMAKEQAGNPDSPFGDPGWGYTQPDLQTVQLEANPVAEVAGLGEATPVHPSLNPRQWTAPLAVFAPGQVPAGIGGTERFLIPMDRRGTVLPPETTPPADGSVLVAQGEAGQRFAAVAKPGSVVRLVAQHRFLRIGEAQTQIPLMMNPHLEANQQRALAFVEEAMTRYDADGFLYDDRLRFGGLNADFSESTRAEFEKHVGRQLIWPDDVVRVTYGMRLQRGIRPGPYFDAWMAFRAGTMQRFVGRVADTVKRIRPNALMGIYAGSWYGDYPNFGANYASTEFEAGYPFLTRAYRSTGFANKLDLFIAGCYYRVGTVAEAMEIGAPTGRTVEAGAVTANRAVRDQSWVYAGIMLADFDRDPKGLASALQAAAASAQGVMVFDLSHDFAQHEPVLRRGFQQPRVAPHTQPGLLRAVRQSRAQHDRQRGKEVPPPFYEGAPGVGF